jgi:hypothetical protein
MASRKKRGQQDKSAMRDLSGRRIKAIEQAKELAEYIAKAPGLERKAREEKRRKLEAIITANPAAGIKMDDHAYWEDKDKLVEGVKSAVRDAVRGVRKEGGSGKVEVVHTVSVRGGGVKRDLKFAGFEEEYEDSSEGEEGEEEGENETVQEDEEEDEDYEDSTDEEDPKAKKLRDLKGKGVKKK